MYLEHYLSYLRIQQAASVQTLKAYEHDLALYVGFLNKRKIRINKVRPSGFSDFVAYLGSLPGKKHGELASRSTIARRISAVAAFHSWLVQYTDGKITSPVLKIHRVRKIKQGPKPIPDSSAVGLKEKVTNQRDRTILAVFLSSALRLSELHQLNADSIRLEGFEDSAEGTFSVGIGEVVGKGNKPRTFLVDARTYDEMSEYLDHRGASEKSPLFVSNRGTRLSKRAIQYVLSRWCIRLGLPAHHIHQLRHTALTQLADNDMPLILIRDLAGHESTATTMGYVAPKRQRIAREYFAAKERMARAQ